MIYLLMIPLALVTAVAIKALHLSQFGETASCITAGVVIAMICAYVEARRKKYR
jgi:1,4-dihydroxy-2-naphthoate octaprenyltransferase